MEVAVLFVSAIPGQILGARVIWGRLSGCIWDNKNVIQNQDQQQTQILMSTVQILIGQGCNNVLNLKLPVTEL